MAKTVKKKKRKLNYKGRQLVRRLIAGLLMISSLIIAAVPSDRSGIAMAATEALDYAADATLARNGDLSSSNIDSAVISAATAAAADNYNSYEVRQLDGRWTLMWKYKYYVPATGIGGVTNVGVISNYNDSYDVDELKLSGDIITCYDFISSSDFNYYVTEAMEGTTCSLNDLKFILDVSPNEGSQALNQLGRPTLLEEVKKYFPEKYEEWKNLYDTKLADYMASHDGNIPLTLADMGMSKLDLTGSDMDEAKKKLYFCDHTLRPGYTLESVKNLARSQEYRKPDNTTGHIPDEDTIYICKAYDATANTERVDDNDFKYLEGMSIMAIGEKAFANTQKVKSMTVGQSVAFIGDSAFENSFINKVEFASVTYIGNRVFKGCQYLNEIDLASKTEIIGKEAFNGCKVLQNIRIPEGVRDIGFGAFSACPVLDTIDFSGNHGSNIGEYGFFDCPLLTTVIFPSSYDMAIGKAAFALTPGTGTSATLTEFDFPSSIKQYVSASAPTEDTYTLTRENGATYSSRLGDYILANRNNLDTVVMPVNFGSSDDEIVPGNTFDMCINLGCLKFDTVSNGYATFDSNLFEDVQNDKLYVFGPATCNKEVDGMFYAFPRRSTWTCSSNAAEYVPYVYYADGTNHYEVGIGDYRYELAVDETNNTATLLRCEFIKNAQDIDLIVPSKVAKFDILDMESGCFDPIKPYIKTIKVEDGSIEMIGDNVFNGCPKLTKVTMGDSVKLIGKNCFSDNPILTQVTLGPNIESVGNSAFMNCPVLNDVYFDAPSAYDTLNTIGTDAFYTGSDKLVFHGDIIEGYLPFDFSMGNNKINSESVRIAYKSLDPTDLTCIMDEATGHVTLIDYPHYCDLPADLRNRYENRQSLNDMETSMLNATMYLYIPEPITSVDVATFLDSDLDNPNRKNFVYISDVPGDLGTNYTRQSIYGDENLKDSSNVLFDDVYKDAGGYKAGLFSGYMYELPELVNAGVNASGFETKGNDWICAIEMPGVKYVPDYCFDSCERLESVIISKDCTDIGEGAFQGCESLKSIGTNDNPKYIFDNYILYETLPDGTYKLSTCLPSRGKQKSSKEVWVNSDNDPFITNVSEINKAAFSGCKNIAKVELSDCKLLKVIPEKCFYGCTRLSGAVLPPTIKNIAKQAFDNGSGAIDVTIPCDCGISDEAFDKDAITTIWTYPECTLTAAYDPVGYDQVYIKFLTQAHKLTFLNDDLSIYDELTVYDGYNGFYPTENPVPLLEEHKGYEFSMWYFDNANGIYNVTENRQALAIFKSPESSSENSADSDKDKDKNKDKDKDKDKDKNDQNSDPNGSSSSNNASNSTGTYNVVVENGAGSGAYESGKVVTITAYSAPNGKTFDRWTTSNSDIAFSNATSISTTFLMPAHDVKVTATYKTGSASSNSANNVGGLAVNGSGGSGRPAGNKGKGETEVKVTTDAIDNNNKNLASATVAGSTDNFVIKITDSAAASAAVEEALKRKYNGDISGIKFVAFDISLYDETGTYHIENYENLAVTITIPIPDDLVSYAGNNKAAAVINGEIDDKAVKFTTIDGVPCMTFTANHFSPYTVYVDVNNLVSGITDLSPKTGLDINPKWFLSIGMALLAGILFLWKEKKPVAKKVKAN